MTETSPAEQIKVVHGADGENRPVFSLLLKRTYNIQPGVPLARAEKTSELRKTDEYYEGGDPEWATIKFEADLVPFKPLADVVLIGKVCVPQGRPVQQMDIGISVAGRSKIIRVFGDRECRYNPEHSPTFTDPVPFTTMELRYERAFGGKDEVSVPMTPLSYPRNDMGCGLVLKNVRTRVAGLPLPNLEDPYDLLTPERIVLNDPYQWNSLPLPQGCGWVHRSWYPRSSFIGSMPPYLHLDEVMREEEMELVPRKQVALSRQFRLPGYDPRFNNGASTGLMFPFIKGDETIRLAGLTPSCLIEFTLPAERPRLMLDIGLGENELDPVLQTVCIRMDEMQVDLIWRGTHLYPGLHWLPEMKQMHAEAA